MAQFKPVSFSIYVAPRPGRYKTLTTPEIFDHIHDLIFRDSRISAKSIVEQLVIVRERGMGSFIREDLDLRKLSAKWVSKMPESEIKTSTVTLV